MGLQSLGLLKNATSASATGGTAITLTPAGVEITSGLYVADAAETDFTVRTNATFTNRNPRLLSDGSWSKGKRTMSMVTPITLADGSTVYPVFSGTLDLHPKMSQAQVDNLRLLACQLLCDADVLSFINTGSLA